VSKKRILFVDDEPKVLQGLQRMLHSMREEWDLDTAESGEEALDKLGRAPCDVIVTDMRMPGMDGAQLLTEVMERHPQIVRIILSGQSDQETIMRSIGPTHQYLSKPCDTGTLKATIDRACALQGVLGNTALRQLISKMQSLPSLPALYTEVLRALQVPDPDLEKIGWIIAQDVAMTAKILHLVNSAFFGFYSNVTHPSRAITILGLDKLRSLVLSIHIFSQFNQERLNHFDVDGLWRHSLHVGQCAKEIAHRVNPDNLLGEQAFMAGMLHDAGKLILISNLPVDYNQACLLAREQKRPLEEAERMIFNASHAEIGAYLFGLWGLANPVLEAIAYHHRPLQCSSPGFTPLTAVYAANALVHAIDDNAPVQLTLDQEYLSFAQTADRTMEWHSLCEKILAKED